jgi:hypothetical protein
LGRTDIAFLRRGNDSLGRTDIAFLRRGNDSLGRTDIAFLNLKWEKYIESEPGHGIFLLSYV